MVSVLETVATIDDLELTRARDAVTAVLDPEVPVLTLADLGVLRGIVRRAGIIVVTLTPTYTGCPATAVIQFHVETALLDAGIENSRVETVLSPPWTTDDMTDAGRAKLKAYGIAPPGRGAPVALFENETVPCPRCNSAHTTKISEFGSTACKAQWRCDGCREPFEYFKCHR